MQSLHLPPGSHLASGLLQRSTQRLVESEALLQSGPWAQLSFKQPEEKFGSYPGQDL